MSKEAASSSSARALAAAAGVAARRGLQLSQRLFDRQPPIVPACILPGGRSLSIGQRQRVHAVGQRGAGVGTGGGQAGLPPAPKRARPSGRRELSPSCLEPLPRLTAGAGLSKRAAYGTQTSGGRPAAATRAPADRPTASPPLRAAEAAAVADKQRFRVQWSREVPGSTLCDAAAAAAGSRAGRHPVDPAEQRAPRA